MSLIIRPYQPKDYEQIAALYHESNLYGGQFDQARDSQERLKTAVERDDTAILVAEDDQKIVGTVSLLHEGRVAELFRFAVKEGEQEQKITEALWYKAEAIFQTKGYPQVLVYGPEGNAKFEGRYVGLGFVKGNNYTCYWKNI